MAIALTATCGYDVIRFDQIPTVFLGEEHVEQNNVRGIVGEVC
jgi:hypothetical protein